mgnify:CR=1 FL=1
MAKINQKYFGNRNIGTTGTGDDKIGGEGIASINWSNYGSWLATAGGSNVPLLGLQLPAPTLPDGVQATWTNYFGVASVSTGAGKAGLTVGDTYTLSAVPGSVITVASTSGTNATFTVTTAGSTTTLATDLQGVNITKLTGAGAGTFLIDATLKIVDTVIGEKGSGYTGSETITVTLANSATGTVPAGTIVLTADTGDVRSSTNQENAIVPYAKTTSGGTSKAADIIKQRSARRFKVKTADGTAICTLKSSAVSDAGDMTITATDSVGGTYYVTKIGGRRVTVTQGTGTQFATGSSVPWTFGTPTVNVNVKLANA